MERLRAGRDALLADPRFRDWAAAFPLTRPIARRRAERLFDLCAGFAYSQTLLAVVRLELLDRLAERPRTAAELEALLRLPPAGLARLLRAAEAIGLVDRRSLDRYGLGPLGAPLVGNREVLAMVEHNALLYRDLAEPVSLLRTGADEPTALAGYWPYAGCPDPKEVGDQAAGTYSALMTASLRLVATEVLAAYPLERHRCLLDVGGGEGGFLELAARRVPALQLMLFDLPAVAERARCRLHGAGLGGRTSVHGGDFFRDALPAGADLVTLLRVLHDHEDAKVLELLARCREALPSGGRLLVAELLDREPGAGKAAGAYFSLYLLAMGRGRARSAEELGALLRAAGFGEIRSLATRVPLQTGVLVATRL